MPALDYGFHTFKCEDIVLKYNVPPPAGSIKPDDYLFTNQDKPDGFLQILFHGFTLPGTISSHFFVIGEYQDCIFCLTLRWI